MELDAKDKMPDLACSSDDIGILLSLHNDPIQVDDRFRSVEEDIRGLRHTLQTVMRSFGGKSDFPPVSESHGSAIHSKTRARLNSESSKRRRTEEGEVPGTDSESELLLEDGFSLPREQQKKIKRQTYSAQARKVPAVAKTQNTGGNERKNYRPKATWGKSNVNDQHLSGPPPELFMMNCRPHIEEENVKQHFAAAGITLLEVKKRSNESARKRSFVLTVSSRDDFDKIMSGDYLPRDVGVRQYYRRRHKPESSNIDMVSEFLASSAGELELLQPRGSGTASAGTTGSTPAQGNSDSTIHQDGR